MPNPHMKTMNDELDLSKKPETKKPRHEGRGFRKFVRLSRQIIPVVPAQMRKDFYHHKKSQRLVVYWLASLAMYRCCIRSCHATTMRQTVWTVRVSLWQHGW